MIIVISPIPICCHLCSMRPSSPIAARPCRNCPPPSAPVMKPRWPCRPYLAAVLSAEKETADWFETALAATARRVGKPDTEVALRVANFISNRSVRRPEEAEQGYRRQARSSPDALAELLALAADGTLSGPLMKQVFEAMLETGEGAASIVESRGQKQVSDTGAIDAAIREVMDANPDKVAEYRSGKGQIVRLLRRPDHARHGRQGPRLSSSMIG